MGAGFPAPCNVLGKENPGLATSLNNEKDFDIDKLIRKVLWGKIYFDIKNKTFLLRHLSIKEQNYLDYMYEKELEKLLAYPYELISESEMRINLIPDKIWTIDNEKAIDKLKKEIKASESELSSIKVTAKTKIQHNKLKRKIKLLNNVLDELIIKKYDLFNNTAESKTDEMIKRLTAYFVLENEQEQSIWKSFEDFESNTNFEIVNIIINKYYSSCFLDEKTIRIIARHPVWRYRWQASKENPIALFGKSIYDLTFDQNNLIYWSQAYDIIYGSIDRPTKRIIENDKLCDIWFEDQGKKAEKSATDKQWNMDKALPAGKVGNQDLFIMAKNEEEAKEIQSLNDVGAQIKIQSERKKIQKADGKIISEVELRKRDLLMQARQNQGRGK